MSKEIQFLLYSLPDDEGKVQVVIQDETLWCTQKAMAQLFGVGVPAISKHLKNIFEENELTKEVVVSKMEITTQHGAMDGRTQSKAVEFYSLNAIIAVGYRVSSMKATRFRQWATKILHEYIKKGFVMDDERLKQGTAVFGKDYYSALTHTDKASQRLLDNSEEKRYVTQNFRNYFCNFATLFPHKSVAFQHLFPHKSVESGQIFPHKSVGHEERYMKN